jgi:predicted RNA binding protein YcfA (HicA-like mRNA interferase family)
MGNRDLPLGPGDRHVRAFELADWRVARTQGSHKILCKDGVPHILSIPCHKGKDVPRALIKKLLDLAGLSITEYCELFRKTR